MVFLEGGGTTFIYISRMYSHDAGKAGGQCLGYVIDLSYEDPQPMLKLNSINSKIINHACDQTLIGVKVFASK